LICLRPEIPVGGRLRFFADHWDRITDDRWVLDTIRHGYKLEFQEIPNFNGIRKTVVPKEKLHFLLQEVEELLQKQAVEEVPQTEINQGFYSTLFLVPKKTGDLRPVINLKPLNKYLRKQHFKMDSLKTVLNLVQKGDFAISIDLKDAYMHIPVFPSHRKYLRFSINNKVYQWTSVPFGPTSAPRVFTKIVAVVASYLRQQNLRLAVYLDDWLGLNALRNRLLQDLSKMINLLIQLGFIINAKKSLLQPTQCITYLGSLFNLKLGTVSPSPDRHTKIIQAIQIIVSKPLSTAKEYLHLLGLMSSCIETVLYARLHMRPVQLHLLHFWKPSSRDLHFLIPLTKHVQGHLSWWLHPVNVLEGKSFLPWSANHTLQTDASMSGWGACLGTQIVQGIWSDSQKRLHINCLEMEAVFLALKKFIHVLRGQKVLIRTDNTTVVQYVNKQGGTKSPSLCIQVWNLWQFAIENKVQLKAAHIAGNLNILPDQLSRVRIRQTEWSLHHSITCQIFALWDSPNIDLFASILNRKAPIFCSWIPHSQALATDALTISWDRMFAYAFPPICLIPRVIQHMKQFRCKIIMIAPFWPRRHWFPELLQMSVAHPIRLPTWPNLLQQPNSQIFHPNPEVFKLTAWLLSTESSEQKAFQRKLENCSQPVGDLEHRKIMLPNLKDSVAGVVRNKLIRIQHL
jgi:ribonuclease HI